MLVITSIHRVALVHHLGKNRPPISVDPNHLMAATSTGVPPGGQRDHHLLVTVVTVVALRRATSVAVLLEAVDGQLRMGVSGDGWRTAVLRVRLARLAAVRAVARVAVAGLAR